MVGFDRVLKKAIQAIFNTLHRKTWFSAYYIFNDFQSLKMAIHPCIAHRLLKTGIFQQPVKRPVAPHGALRWLWIGGILLSLVAVPAAGAAESPWKLIERMAQAARKLNYDGVFVYRSGGHMQSLRVIHRGVGGAERERMITLDGAAREIVRDQQRVTCILPEQSTITVGKRSPPLISTASIFAPGRIAHDGIERRYVLGVGTGMRIAGRPTKLLAVEPRDRFRYGYRLFADEHTGLLLKSQLVNGADGVLEELVYTSIAFPPRIDDALLNSSLTGDGYRRVAINSLVDPVTSKAGKQGWKVGWLPDGFKMSERTREAFGPRRQGVRHLVYSDGLAYISVFIELAGLADAPPIGRSRTGAVSVFSTDKVGHRVTVVGAVPGETVERVGRSVTRR